MNSLNLTYHGMRRARVKSLVQIGSLVDQAGLLETFGITLGEDLQKAPELKMLFKGLLVLNDMVTSGEAFHKELWSYQGLEALRELNERKRH
ncbi:MAG: hypothetical protein KBD36_03210 [Alphaproteobacteria bacterium]|jgi:hypothetical protein|nr:hypothetical protein [Alphaproteobacteria bacterium]MBP9776834.1 hypothetical protein [Alphaproteobacteria bacterium]